MRKKVVLLGSISIAIVCVVLVITSMSAIAGNVWSDGKIEPQPPVPRIERIDEPNYQVNLSTSVSSNKIATAFRSISTITPNWSIAGMGNPKPGEVMVYTYTLRADSADGENIDAMILHVPSGWEVIEFSDAPPKNTSCDGNSVASIAYMDERDVIYWGNDITRPDNWENLSTPPDDIDRSECGIYEANGTSEITFWFRVRIGLDAETCPGAPNFVGIPFDGPIDDFSYTPILANSMPAWVFGDGDGVDPTTLKLNLQQPCPLPQIHLEKYVGFPDTCPNIMSEFLYVVPGSVVEYCYIWWNISEFVTVTNHYMVDDQLGSIELLDFALMPEAPAYLALTHTVTGTIGTQITNTATWEASTDEGYGQSPQDNLLAPFAFLAYEDSSTDTAVVEFVEATHSAYLPVIYHSFPPTIPVQISPENGAVLDTLIPDLVIDGGENPPYDIIRVYLGTSRYTMTPIHHLQSTADTLVLNSNLEPATEYFWRLCFVDDVDGADLQCSLIWSFTTGSGGIIPGIPTLSSPEDGATGIELDNISVSWEAVDNALLYEVFLHPQGDEFNYLIITNQLSANYSNYFDFDPDTLHTWRVRAKNDYAWGEFSETWTFTTAASR